MKNFINIALIIFFGTILILPTIAEIIPLFPEAGSTENRAKKQLPKLALDNIELFPEEFDNFYTDHIKLRNYLLRLNSQIKFHWFNIPPYSGKAFIGKQGWMYTIKDQMDHYSGKTIFSPDTLKRFIDVINYRKRILDSMHCRYYFVIIPIKTTVYPEYIPLSKKISNQTTLTDQLASELIGDSNIKIIDLRDVLIQQKKELNLYYKTDNHWNEYGAYLAYDAILKAISLDYPGLQAIDISNFKIEIIESEAKRLADLMGIIDGVTETEVLCRLNIPNKGIKGDKSDYISPDYFPYKDTYEQVYVTNDSSQPKLLVIHDSFGNTLIPFLSEHFSKSVYIFDGWQHNLNEDILFNEQPDIFIQLVSESLLPNIPKNAKKP